MFMFKLTILKDWQKLLVDLNLCLSSSGINLSAKAEWVILREVVTQDEVVCHDYE